MTRKAVLRERVRERLKAMSHDDRAWKSYLICDFIQQQRAWKEAKIVCLFAALPTEPVVELLWDDIRVAGKKACYPKVNGDNLSLILVNGPGDLVASRWQLREPVLREPNLQSLEKIDLLLVPGMAFSHNGGRLGRGGGFYDRLLARENLRAYKLGVCFDAQIVPDLPLESHDLAVDEVVTESGVFTPATAGPPLSQPE